MKVLHLNRLYYSGQTTHVFSLVKEQQKQGHLAHLVLESHPSIKLLETFKKTIEELNVTVIKPGDEETLNGLIKQNGYNLIHSHSSLIFSATKHLFGKFNLPYVITCHGLGLNKEEFRPFLNEAGALFCISQRVAAGLHEFNHKIHVIPNGVDLQEFKPAAKSDPVKIALVARIDPYKQRGFYQLCKAVELLEGVVFYVVANRRPTGSRVRYLGWTENISDLLAKTDIVIGTGRNIVEGMAAGNAAVILGRTYQGLLTPEKIEKLKYLDLSGLSGSEPCYKTIFLDLAKLVQNPIYLQRLQEYGRRLAAEHFDNKVISEQIMSIYRQVVNNNIL